MRRLLRGRRNFQIKIQQLFLLILLTGFTAKSYGATFYWVGGSGSWRSFNQHWATTSGGQVFYSQEPTLNDDVVFDENSFTASGQIVKADTGTFICRSMTWTGVRFVPTFTTNNYNNSILKIYGSLVTVPTMNWAYIGTVNFESTAPGNIIVPPKNIPPYYGYLRTINFNGTGGWALKDSLKSVYIYIHNGTFKTNGYNVKSDYDFKASGFAELNLGKSRITTANFGVSRPASGILRADSSLLVLQYEFVVSGGGNYNKVVLYSWNTYSPTNCTVREVIATNRLVIGGSNGITQSLLATGTTEIYGTQTYNKAEFRNDVSIMQTVNSTFDTLILNNPGKTLKLFINTTQTIRGELITVPTSCAQANIKINSSTAGTQATISKTSGTIACSNLTLQDIKATGGATFTTTNSILVSNVTGWTISEPAPRSLYWVGGTGEWSNSAHWSLTSGGTGGECAPRLKDDVTFNASSFTAPNQGVVFDQTQSSCKNLLFTGVLHKPFVQASPTLAPNPPTSNLDISGSFTLSPDINWIYTGNVNFKAQTPGNVINTAKQPLNKIFFDGPGGGWTLQDSLKVNAIDIKNGSFNTNSKLVRCKNDFTGTAQTARSILLGNSILYCNMFEMFGAGLTIDAGNSVIHALRISSTGVKFNKAILYLPASSDPWASAAITGENLELDSVICEVNSIVNASSSQRGIKINDLLFKKTGYLGGSTVAKLEARNTLDFDYGNTIGTLYLNNTGFITNISNDLLITDQLIANGSCTSGYITIQSKYPGSATFITKTSGNVNCDRIIVKDITAKGGAIFTASNSVNGGNVSGWIFTGQGARTLYWIGNSGNWTDPAHWSNISGGTGGACLPTLSDNVIFDNNSFTSNATVTVDASSISCRDMSWKQNNHTVAFAGVTGSLSVYGSFAINYFVNWTYEGQLKLSGQGRGKKFITHGIQLKDVIFEGSGSEWLIPDSLHCDNFSLTGGHLRFDHMHAELTCSNMIGITADTLELGNTRVTSFYWTNNMNPDFAPCLFDAGTSNITAYFFTSYKQRYNHISVGAAFGYGIINSVDCTFKDAIFTSGETDFYQCSNNTFTKATFLGNVDLKGNQIFKNATFKSNASIMDANTFDTVTFDNPGRTVTFGSGKTQTINHAFKINSQQTQINFKGSTAGSQANISTSLPDLCFDYLGLRDMAVTGGSLIHAGSHSSNQGNNTGWIFAPCVNPISNVWPGDANNDTIVDCKDLLNIGLAYGETGTSRANASFNWIGQPSLDWNTIFSNFVNVKHADCDGNGIVDSLDLKAVRLNYGKTHAAQRVQPTNNLNGRPSSNSLDLLLDPVSPSYNAGVTIDVPIILRALTTPAASIYGISFDVNYDKAYVQDGSVSLTYENSTLVPSNNRIQLQKDFYISSVQAVAFSRINKSNTTGNGIIAWLHLKLKNNVSGTFPVSFSSIKAVDASGALVSINAITANIVIADPVGITIPAGAVTSSTCPGNTTSLAYTVNGTFNPGNSFTAELSDSTGSFTNPVVVGTKTSVISGSMLFTVPLNSKPSLLYKLRIKSSSPGLTSNESSSFEIARNAFDVVTITGPRNVCPYKGTTTNATYSINTVAGATSYFWELPTNAIIVSGQGTTTITVSYSANFTSGLLFASAQNNCATRKTSITVTAVPNKPGSIAGPVNACPFINSGTNAVYTIAAVVNATSYAWTVPTNASIVSGQGTNSITVKYISAFASGDIAVSSKTACGTSSPETLAVVKQAPAIPSIITGPSSICSFIGNPAGAVYSVDEVTNAASYAWIVPVNATIANGQGTKSITVVYASGFTSGNISVKAVSSCANSASRTLKVTKTIPALPGAITGPVNVCAYTGQPANATYSIAAVLGATSYNWVVSANASIVSGQGTTQIEVSYSNSFTAGTISVQAVAICGSSASKTLTLNKIIPTTPATLTGPANACIYAGTATKATYTARAVSGATSYLWTAPADASIESGQGTTQITVKYLSSFISGTLSVQAVVSCGSSAPKTMEITKTIPNAPATINGSATVCQYAGTKSNSPYSIAAIVNATSYEWSIPANTSIVSGQGSTRIVLKIATGFTAGEVSVKSISPCGNSATTTIQITGCSTTPRITGENKIGGFLVSEIYPNPSASIAYFEIESDHTAEVLVEISDFTGRIISTKTAGLSSGTTTITNDLQDLKTGVYFIKIIDKETNEVLIRKIVKE